MMRLCLLRAATVPMAFAAWDDGTSFPWTLAEATEDSLTNFFGKWSKCERTRSKPMLEDASDVLVVVDAASSRGFLADGLRTFMRDFEQTFHVLVALEASGRGRRRGRRRRRDGGDGVRILRRAAGRGRSRGAGAGGAQKSRPGRRR